MHDAIQYAVRRVTATIPQPILEDAFGNAAVARAWGQKTFSGQVPVSIESRIISEVIDGRVRADADLTGAKQIDIRMAEVEMRQNGNWTWLIRVPDEAVAGCRITQFLGIYIVESDWLSGTNYPWLGQNTLTQGAHGLIAAAGPIPSISSENGHLVGHNTIEVNDMNVVRNSGMLRVKVESDASMSHLQPASYARWGDLVLLGTKSYIYNQLVVRMGRGRLESGYDLGVYKEIVDDYRDAEESYQDLLRGAWRRVVQFNDPNRRRRHIRFKFGRQ